MAPYVLDPEQIEGYEAYWSQANTRNFPYLPARSFTRDGRPFLPIQRNVAEPAIQAVTLAAHEAKDDIHATTGVPPVALGQLDPHERSGRAIQALQGQAEVGTSGFLDNLASMSMPYEGKVVRDLIPRIYDRPGRIVPAVGIDEKRRQVMIGVPFVQQGGQPVAAHPDDPAAELIDLKAGAYSVAVTIGKSFTTRRQETAAVIGELMQVIPPEMAAAIAPAWLEEQDYPGAKKIAAIAKTALPPALQKAYDEDQGSPRQIPPELEAQITAMQQELEQAKQQIAVDGAKQQATIQKAQLDSQTALQQAEHDGQIKLQIAAMTQETQLRLEEMKLRGIAMQAEIDAAENELARQAGHAQAVEIAQIAATAKQPKPGRTITVKRGPDGAVLGADVQDVIPEFTTPTNGTGAEA
jgi:hypothetical protein